MTQLLKHKPGIHSPTLNTIQMVESIIHEAKEPLSPAEIKRRLPRKVNHNTLKSVLVYLQNSGKVEFTLYGIVWTFMPKENIAAILAKGRTWKEETKRDCINTGKK